MVPSEGKGIIKDFRNGNGLFTFPELDCGYDGWFFYPHLKESQQEVIPVHALEDRKKNKRINRGLYACSPAP